MGCKWDDIIRTHSLWEQYTTWIRSSVYKELQRKILQWRRKHLCVGLFILYIYHRKYIYRVFLFFLQTLNGTCALWHSCSRSYTLDLVITRKIDSIIQDTPISGSFLSDHATVLFNLKGSKSESSAKEVWFRKIKSINLPKFKNDIRTSELLLNTPNHLVDLVNCFNTTLKSITDKHAPWRKRSMTQRA